MTDAQVLELRASEIRSRLAELGQLAEVDAEQRAEMDTLGKEYAANESRQRALKIAGDLPPEPTETREDSEGKELRELRANVEFGKYIAAALAWQWRPEWAGTGIQPASGHSQ